MQEPGTNLALPASPGLKFVQLEGQQLKIQDSNAIGEPTATHTLAEDSPVPASIWVANAAGVLTIIAFFAYMSFADGSSPLLSIGSIVCYLIFSVLIDTDISAAGNGGSGFKFEPACSVLLVEVGKLITSIILYTVNRVKVIQEEQKPFIDENMKLKDVMYLAAPGLLFAVNNILVYLSIGFNEVASFGVFRDTNLFFTAALWCVVFKSKLGWERNLALSGVFLGLCVNQITPLLSASLSAAVFIILAMAMTNACGSVANEYAIKQNAGLDLNMQNAVLYSFCIVWALLYIVILKPAKLTSVGAFFQDINATAWAVIVLQICAGLMVSRILKYADATTKTVACCLRGPILVFLAPLLGLHSRLDFLTGLSSIMVGTAACYFLMQGRPKAGNAEEVEAPK